MNEELNSIFPPHKCGLHVTHNEHKDYYETLTEYLGERDFLDIAYWKDAEARKRALDTNECWQIKWYPDVPIGFYHVFAPTFAEVVELANAKAAKD